MHLGTFVSPGGKTPLCLSCTGPIGPPDGHDPLAASSAFVRPSWPDSLAVASPGLM